MGIDCALPAVSPSPLLLVSPSPCLLVSLSFLSVNVEFLRVALDWRAGFARQREYVVSAIFGRQVELFEQFDDRRIRAHPHTLGFKLHDGEARGGQRHSDHLRSVFAVVLVDGSLASVLRVQVWRPGGRRPGGWFTPETPTTRAPGANRPSPFLQNLIID